MYVRKKYLGMLSLKFLWYVFRNMVDICYTFGEREGNKFPPFRWITGPSETGGQGGWGGQSFWHAEKQNFLLPKTLDYYLTSTPPSEFQTFLRPWSGGAVRSPQGHRCCGLQWLRMQKNPLSTNAWLAGILWKLLNFSRFVTFFPSDLEVTG